MSEVIQVTDDSFEQQVLQADKPILVDYWAPWCGPCKTVSPIVEATAESRDGQIRVAQVNVDENTASMQRYGIRGIPTLMLFKNGEVTATQVGAVSQQQLNAFLDQHL